MCLLHVQIAMSTISYNRSTHLSEVNLANQGKGSRPWIDDQVGKLRFLLLYLSRYYLSILFWKDWKDWNEGLQLHYGKWLNALSKHS